MKRVKEFINLGSVLALLIAFAPSPSLAQTVANAPTSCEVDDGTGTAPPVAAIGVNSFACGPNASAEGEDASAIGANAAAVGARATAVGANSVAAEDATAVGAEATATATNTTALGLSANATATNATALGANSDAAGTNSLAVGGGARALGPDSTALGANAVAGIGGAIAIGTDANASGSDSVVIGSGSSSTSSNTTIVGARSNALGQATLLGNDIQASGVNAIGVGRGTTVDGESSIAIGNASRVGAGASQSVAVGHFSWVSSANGTAIGNQTRVDGEDGTAVGRSASVLFGATSAGAFGAGSIADRSNTISIGNAALQRQLTYLAAGTEDTDGVNVAQLKALMAAFGGGANYNGGIFGAPSFVFASGSTFNDVNSALLYLDGRITTISLTPGPQGPQGPQGPAGTPGTPGAPGSGGAADCNVAVCYDDASRRSATLNAGGPATTLRNVNAGVADTDAVNVGQMRAADLEVLNQANSYTDNRVSNILTVIDDRFEDIDAQLNRGTAINTAMTMMASSAAGVRDENRIAVGVGASGSEKAIAAGYQRAFDNGAVATFGVSFSGGETTAGIGFGFGF